jgi:class 3 adenylate cyclase/tetratricopeptide (TPR) repeat protein
MEEQTCSNCGAANPAEQRFCDECGNALLVVCVNGHESPAGQKFCGECGEALGTVAASAAKSPAPTEDPGERRLVSVLFADLVGFTPFSESRDPEEVRAMLTRYFDRARLIVERFGGEVDKFIGDAVTAFWGAHQTQEDDAEWAVRAALELVDSVTELGEEIGVPELALRVGVLSGEASVGSGGNEKGLVVGDIVNTAARLQAAADPGSVFVGEATQVLTASAIRFEEVGEHDLKGKSLPVSVWRAVDVAAEVGGKGRVEGLEAPFVGREAELRMLKDQIHATTREQRARLVSIVGEAGIGKSRLAWEMQKYLDGVTEVFRWHQGRSPAYGDGVTFWALGEMIRHRARIAETDEALESRTKLRTAVAEYVPNPDEQRWIEPRLAGLLGLDDMPPGDRNELFAALRTFFQRVAETATEILVFEDLHWADAGLLEFIEELVERSPRHPILIVTLARPDLLEGHPQWGTGRRSFLATHLGPLADEHMAKLVEGLAPGIPEDVVSLIVDRADGIPLYAVEFTRMLISAGDLTRSGDRFEMTDTIEELAIPDSLRSVIAARLDRLDPELRGLVQDASVLGYSFAADGLEIFGERPDLTEQLRELVHHELLEYEADELSPERGQYRFIQALIREVAYARLARSERRDRHVRVAEHYDGLGDVEYSAVVASHYVDAYASDPSDELALATRYALQRAAERAAELHSNQQVLGLVRRAIDLTAEGADLAALHGLAAAAAQGLVHLETAEKHAMAALKWHQSQGSTDDATLAATLLGSIHTDAARPGQAIEAMKPFYDPAADGVEQAILAGGLARAYFLNQQANESLPVVEHALFLAEKHRAMPTFADAIVTKGSLLLEVGRVQEGLLVCRGSLEFAEQHNLARTAGRAIVNLTVNSEIDGNLAVGEYARRGLEMCIRTGDAHTTQRMVVHRASWLMNMHRFEEALELLEREFDYELETYVVRPDYIRGMIEWMRTGDAEAREAIHRTMDSYLSAGEPQTREGGKAALAWIALLAREYKSALDQALEVRLLVPWTNSVEAALIAALLLGDQDSFRRAVGYAEPWPYPGRKQDALELLVAAGRAWLDGRGDAAIAAFSKLISIYDEAFTVDRRVQMRMLFASLMGTEVPQARAAAEAAAAGLTEAGAHHLLELWKDVVPSQAAEAAS